MAGAIEKGCGVEWFAKPGSHAWTKTLVPQVSLLQLKYDSVYPPTARGCCRTQEVGVGSPWVTVL